jgi:menaquinone-dependent protoporphyrinogen IX oxidase
MEAIMNIRLIYFSQTGNTRKVAHAMAAVFNGKNHSANTISYKKMSNADFTEPDMIGVGAPCFESQAPSIVRESSIIFLPVSQALWRIADQML